MVNCFPYPTAITFILCKSFSRLLYTYLCQESAMITPHLPPFLRKLRKIPLLALDTIKPIFFPAIAAPLRKRYVCKEWRYTFTILRGGIETNKAIYNRTGLRGAGLLSGLFLWLGGESIGELPVLSRATHGYYDEDYTEQNERDAEKLPHIDAVAGYHFVF